MSYRLLADAVVVAHLLFIVFVVLGCGLVPRWPGLAVVHVPAVSWGVFIELSGAICPLTPLENAWRQTAGEAGYAGGFIEHYLLPIIYPVGLTRGVQFALAALVIVVNVGAYGWLVYRWRRSR